MCPIQSTVEVPEGGAALAETVQLWLGGARWGWAIGGIYRGRMQKLEVIKVWIMDYGM
jgi:hypothetical protein